MGYYLLTGATGLLGSFVLRDALLADLPMAVIVRAGDRAEARARLEVHLQEFERQLGHTLPRPVVFAGDLSQEGLGLDHAAIEWLAENVTAVIHSAASLSFTSTADGEPWTTNVTGTWNLLGLCSQLKPLDFHHVSTAYVCGLRHDTVREGELTIGQSFANPYEVSKVLAERMVGDAAWLRSTTIYRPSIIVGDSQTGYSSTFHGFYRPLQLADMLNRGRSEQAPRLINKLGLSGDERKNFVAVDWVSNVLLHIVQQPQHYGRVYHLTNPQPATVEMLEAAIAAAITDPTQTPEPSGSRPQPPPPAADKPVALADAQFLVGMDVYRSYLRDDPTFDRSNTLSVAEHIGCPTMDAEQLTFLARAAVAAEFQPPRTPLASQAFDCHAAIADLSPIAQPRGQSIATETLNLQLTGPWGGAWQLQFVGDAPQTARTGSQANADCDVRLSTATLEAIVDGRWTVGAAIYAGLVFVALRAIDAATAERWIATLITALRDHVGAAARPIDRTKSYVAEPATN